MKETRSAFMLTPSERKYLRLWKAGLKQVEIAMLLRVRRQSVSKILLAGIGKIKAQMDLAAISEPDGHTSLHSARGHIPGQIRPDYRAKGGE